MSNEAQANGGKPITPNGETKMTKIAIINDKTGKTISRNVEISDFIDNNGNQFSQAVSKDGLVARLRCVDGEREWFLV